MDQTRYLDILVSIYALGYKTPEDLLIPEGTTRGRLIEIDTLLRKHQLNFEDVAIYLQMDKLEEMDKMESNDRQSLHEIWRVADLLRVVAELMGIKNPRLHPPSQPQIRAILSNDHH